MSGIPVARRGDLHLCPIPGHASNPIMTGAADSSIDGRPVARVGDTTACGARIVTGAPGVSVSGEQVAHIGSLTDHGGVITTGSLGTLVGAPGAALALEAFALANESLIARHMSGDEAPEDQALFESLVQEREQQQARGSTR